MNPKLPPGPPLITNTKTTKPTAQRSSIRATLYLVQDRLPGAGALGIHVQDVEPIHALCRKLMSIGYDATQPIEFHQGRNIAAKFDSLAEGSRYKPKRRRAEANTSPPVSSAE
jgi:hypothetical protein